ncbi:MAG: GAF domain-containing protein [Pseudomonadota bacterium]
MANVEPSSGELSKREKEVAAAYAAGGSYKEIARDLSVSPTTVRSHLRTIYVKLGVTSKIELARFLDDASTPDDPRDSTAMAAELALELDDAVRRERMFARVLRIINTHDGTLEAVIDDLLEHALEICEAEFGILFEYHGDFMVSELRSRGISPAFSAWLAEIGTFKVEPTTGVGRAASELKAVSITDVRTGGVYEGGSLLRKSTVDFGNARSLAAIPMTSGDRLIGVFSIYRTRIHPFSDRTLELVQLFADQAAIAIENVRQFNELQARLDRAQSNREILDLVRQSRADEQPVFEAIARSAVDLCKAQFCMLWRYDGTDIHYCASHGFSDGFMDAYLVDYPMAPNPDGIVYQVLQNGQTVHLPNAQAEPYSDAAVARRHGYDYMLGVPVDTEDRTWGVMVLAWPTGQSVGDGQVELLETFAAQAVIAIENAGQFRELQARLDRAAATHEVLEAIRDSRNDEAPVLDVILRRAAQLCAADAAAMTLGREGDERQHLAAALDMHPKTRALYREGKVSMNPETSLVARAIVTRTTLHVPDYADTDDYRAGEEVFRSLVDDTGMRTSINVPLLSRGKGIGALVLYRKTVDPYAPDQIALVETFAAQASIAIENVRQFRAMEALNASLETQVQEQVGQIERMGRLKRFLSPAVADALANSGDESALASHRALIATLFCDIRGFTAFCEVAEPEETIEVLQAYHEEMGTLISAHGGGVDKRMGDGIMVIFNDPLPCDDPAGDAVRLAIAMQDRMTELCKSWRRLGHRLGFGVGVSLGYATIGMVGSEGRYDYTASGTAVNLAARLCDRAEDGEILLSPRAYTAIEDEFTAQSDGELRLKGIREPVEVFRLVCPQN